LGFPIIFLQWLNLATYKIDKLLGFSKARHKIPHRRKSGRGPELEKLDPQHLGLTFNICAMAEARNFKFDKQLRFAKAYHKTTPRGESGRGLGLGKLPNIWGSL